METSTSTGATAPKQMQAMPPTTPTRRVVPMGMNMKLSTAPTAETIKKNYAVLDTFSPVNQNGSFEFDRVLKTGAVLKRTRKTKVIYTA